MANFAFIKPWLAPVGIFCLNLATRLVYFLIIGVRDGGDSWFYLQNARIIIDHQGNPLPLLELGIYPYYWLYPIFLAIMQLSEPVVVVVQIILQALAAVLLFLIGKKLWRLEVGLLAGVAFAFFFEVWQWDTYILTDSMYMTALTVSVYLVLWAFAKKTLVAWTASAISIGAAFLLRPTSVVYVACVAFLGIMMMPSRVRIYAAALVVVLVAAAGWYLTVFGSQKAFGVAYSVWLYRSTIEQGIVVRDRPEYSLQLRWDPQLSFKNVIQTISLLEHRAVAFWRFYIPAHSATHRVLNLATFAPLYLFGIVGFWHSFVGRKLDIRTLFLTSIIVGYFVFHILTEVDYDWRYRVPVLPWVLLFASYGVVIVWDRLNRNFTVAV